jgi:hypothetical protein
MLLDRCAGALSTIPGFAGKGEQAKVMLIKLISSHTLANQARVAGFKCFGGCGAPAVFRIGKFDLQKIELNRGFARANRAPRRFAGPKAVEILSP